MWRGEGGQEVTSPSSPPWSGLNKTISKKAADVCVNTGDSLQADTHLHTLMQADRHMHTHLHIRTCTYTNT